MIPVNCPDWTISHYPIASDCLLVPVVSVGKGEGRQEKKPTRQLDPLFYEYAEIRQHYIDETGKLDLERLLQNPKAQRIRNRLIANNLGLVQKIAHKMKGNGQESVDELISIGLTGAMKAIDRFDPSLQFAFSSLAVTWIRGAIQHARRDQAWEGGLKIPRSWFDKYGEITLAYNRSIASGRKVSLRYVVEIHGLTWSDWKEIVQATQRRSMFDLDKALLYPCPSSGDAVGEDTARKLYKLIARVPRQHRSILLEHYWGRKDAAKISRSLKLPVVTVQRLLTESIERLKVQAIGSAADA